MLPPHGRAAADRDDVILFLDAEAAEGKIDAPHPVGSAFAGALAFPLAFDDAEAVDSTITSFPACVFTVIPALTSDAFTSRG